MSFSILISLLLAALMLFMDDAYGEVAATPLRPGARNERGPDDVVTRLLEAFHRSNLPVEVSRLSFNELEAAQSQLESRLGKVSRLADDDPPRDRLCRAKIAAPRGWSDEPEEVRKIRACERLLLESKVRRLAGVASRKEIPPTDLAGERTITVNSVRTKVGWK